MKEKPLEVLLVEDSAGDARLLREMFSKEAAGSFRLTHLSYLRDAEVHLAKGGVDIVLLDMGLPDGHGLETVRRAHAAASGVPMIVLTGLDDEVLAAEAMKEGAQDYLIKGQIENRALPRALRHAIERHRMQREAELIQTHQLQFKDEFLSHVSHELRSPLFAIYQFVTILLDKLAGEVNQDQRRYLEIVLKNVEQLQSMIDDLLEVSRLQTGKLTIELQRTSISDGIDYTINTLQAAAHAKSLTLSSATQSGLPSIWSDPKRVRQILIILVDNAIKFTPAEGTVQVWAGMLGDPNFVTVEVTDSGCGISQELIPRIFERLFQATDPSLAGRNGLGLGLHICRELVTGQGGQIWASSVLGKGSVFSVTLPVFSLATLIAPVFGQGKRAEGDVILVVVEIGSKSGWLSDEVRAERSHSIRATLQQCLYSDRDILLPRLCDTGAVELFFIVARADEIGGAAITKRIAKQLDGREYIQHADLTLSVAYRPLKANGRNGSESVEDSLQKLATRIQEIMDEEISLRMAASG